MLTTIWNYSNLSHHSWSRLNIPSRVSLIPIGSAYVVFNLYLIVCFSFCRFQLPQQKAGATENIDNELPHRMVMSASAYTISLRLIVTCHSIYWPRPNLIYIKTPVSQFVLRFHSYRQPDVNSLKYFHHLLKSIQHFLRGVVSTRCL